LVAQLVDSGPKASGVYARFTGRGSSLALLDPRGQVVRRLTGGAGLVAATADGTAPPTWLVTGTNRSGVDAAAGALTPSALRNHFALAVQGATRLPVPLDGLR
jgi:hypothetical protein